MDNLRKQLTTQYDLKGMKYLVPNAICKLITSATIFINLYWSRTHQVQLVGMSVSTLFSFAFGYLIIISLNLSLAYEIGRSRDQPHSIGIFYQRALVINFIICAFLITPLLYLSNKIVILFIHIDEKLATVIGQYLFQLVPSIYLFVFYDTTQTYLLAQNCYLAVLVINIFGFFCHFYFINHLGAAWSKNLTDLGRCIAIYGYLTLKIKNIQSWIEWTIQCFKGWENHLNYFSNIGLATYSQTFFIFVFATIGYNLPQSELICHISFVNIAQIVFIVNIGLKQGLIIKLAYYIRKKKIKYSKKIGMVSLKIFFALSLSIVFLMLMYNNDICNFFLNSTEQKQIFKQNYWLISISIVVDSLNTSLSTLIKVFNKRILLLRYQNLLLILQTFLGYIFGYKLGGNISGLWMGWTLGSLINIFFNWKILTKYQNFKLRSGNTNQEMLLNRNEANYYD